MFEVGDKFRRINGAMGLPKGYEGVVQSVSTFGVSDAKGCYHKFENISQVIKTRRTIVPGKYGHVNIDMVHGVLTVETDGVIYSAAELREAAHIFNQIAEILEEND